MELEILSNGMFGSNGYILIDNGEAVLIDSGVPSISVIDILNNYKARLKYILLTHGHIDHICSVEEIRNATGAKVLIHKDDAECLIRDDRNLSSDFMRSYKYNSADKELTDGDEIQFGNTKIKVIYTPGHSRGGCCYLIEDMLFSGDTLFNGSIGRTDFYGGDFDKLISSIKERLLVLPDNIKVYPGHGADSTIGNQRMSNPFLR